MKKIKKEYLLIGLLLCISLSANAQNQEFSIDNNLKGLSQLWKEVSYNFGDPEYLKRIDWDSLYVAYIPKIMAAKNTVDYYSLLDGFMNKLENPHSDIFFNPGERASVNDFCQIDLAYVEDQVCVVNMGASLKEKLPLGSVITAIDSIPIKDYLDRNYLYNIAALSLKSKMALALGKVSMGLSGSKFNLSYLTPDNEKREIVLYRNVMAEGAEDWVYPFEQWEEKQNKFCMLKDHNIAYLRLSSFDESEADSILSLIEANYENVLHAKGIIIDVRKNSGGSDRAWIYLAGLLCKGDSVDCGILKSRVNSSYYKSKGALSDSNLAALLQIVPNESVPFYTSLYQNVAQEEIPVQVPNYMPENIRLNNSVVILISPYTASAAESFALAIQNMNRGVLCGEQTMGSLGQPLLIPLPYGGIARICTVQTCTSDGRNVSSGISPDVEVFPTIEGVVNNKDEILEKGIEILENNLD